MMEPGRVRLKVAGVRTLCAGTPEVELLRISKPQWQTHRVVFNCSLTYKGETWNELWVLRPMLTSRLIRFLLRFTEHAAGVSSDITWMFHQVQLLPEDEALLFSRET